MERNYNVIDNYLSAFTRNEIDSVKYLLSDSIEIEYSTLGKANGKDSVIDLLTWESFPIHTTTITNTMTYTEEAVTKVGCIVHHFVAREKGPQLYPLNFGGKYVFTLQNNKIVKVQYAQEYQVENTLFIRNWKFAKKKSDLGFLDFDLQKVLSGDSSLSTITKVFFWALDSKKMDILKEICSDSIYIKRYRTMSFGNVFEATSFDTLETFIDETKEYYSMDQYSITIRDTQDHTVIASHLIPYRLGTKKLNTHTKYNSYYDEDIILSFENNKIINVEINKIADFSPAAFEVRHAD